MLCMKPFPHGQTIASEQTGTTTNLGRHHYFAALQQKSLAHANESPILEAMLQCSKTDTPAGRSCDNAALNCFLNFFKLEYSHVDR